MDAVSLYDVINVSYLKDYKLLVTFDNGERKIVNLERQVKEAENKRFGQLRDKEYFKTVHVEADLGTIAWDNGYDVCPHLLYQMGEDAMDSEVSAAL